jgi:hypothetical protein
MSFQFSGSLQDTPLADIARLFQSTRRTGCLSLSLEGSRGTIYFERGEMVDSQANQLSGLDAIRHLGRFNRGTFEFIDNVSSPARTLDEYTSADLITVLETRLMEALQIHELIPLPNEIPHYLGGVLPASFEVTAPELAVAMKAASGRLSVSSLASQLGLDLAMVGYTVARFRAAGLMDLLSGTDDSGPETEAGPPPPSISARPTEPLPPTPGATPGKTGSQPRYWRGRRIE